MPASVSVNNLTVVHKSSDGVSSAFPDVCKTPAAPSPIPIPYPNIAKSSDAADTASSVKADGNPLMVKDAKYATSTGDEAGSLNGVMSNKVKGSANPQMWSMDVKAEGKNVFRQLDIMLLNGGSKPTNTPPGPNAQPPKPASASGKDPKKEELIEVAWSKKTCRCGDEVGVGVKTGGFDDGEIIPLAIVRGTKPRVIDRVNVKISGQKGDVTWISRNGPWQKDETQLKAKANGRGGEKSSENLKVEIPAEYSRTFGGVKGGKNTHLTALTLRRVAVPSGTTLAHKFKAGPGSVYISYGYDLVIRNGRLTIECKIKLLPQKDVNTGKKFRYKKKIWKQTIENIWSRKFKEHRVACKRGDGCDCPGGCCLFAINIKCSFVSSGEHVQVKLHAGRPATNLWNCDNWWEDINGVVEASGANVYAHEFGHNIGLWDEYSGPNPASVLPLYFNIDKSIMGRGGTEVFSHHFTAHPSAGESIHQRFLDAVNDKYKVMKIK